MLKRLLIAAAAATLAVGLASADQSTGKLTIPVTKTAPTSGKQMFVNYCAPCHGVDGRGNGPAAPALKTPPTDLTVLSRNNHGKYPDTHIVTTLQYGSELPSHGSAQMPVWGPIFGKMNTSNSQDRMLRVSNLSRYLETLQVK
jgi:mono/diheme cytochrome c family protein